MDDGTFNSAMSDPQGIMQLINQQFNSREQGLNGMANLIQLLSGRNTYLTEEINRCERLEMNLTSEFIKIKTGLAEAQQMSGMTDANHTVAGASATGGRRGRRSIYHEIMDFLRDVSRENIVLSERLRREGELLAEVKQDAAESASRHQKMTSDLMTKLNSLQTRKEKLYDEQCASEWHRIQQALDHWTRQTFRDKSAMSQMTAESLQKKHLSEMPQKEHLQSIQAKRAFIQSTLSGIIFEYVLKSPLVSDLDPWTENALKLLGEGVKKSASSYDWEIWRSSTSKGLENCQGSLDGSFDIAREILSSTAENCFGDFFSPNARKIEVHKELKKIFDNCLAFKKTLERQEFEYVFRQSPRETVYSAEKMNSVNHNEAEGSIVIMSTWPSIYKVSFDNEELVIEREAVWTKGPAQVDNSATEHHPHVEKEIKPEVKTEDNDDEMGGVAMES